MNLNQLKQVRQNKKQRMNSKLLQKPKSQSRSLKKQKRAGSSVCQKSKSLQKKPLISLDILSSLMFTRYNNGQIQQLLDTQNQIIDKNKNICQRKRIKRKQNQRETKKKLITIHSKKIKFFIGNKLGKKLQSYFLFLSLAKFTIGAPIAKSFYCQNQNKKFTIFVGKGNNSKLVKNLFYARHWWNVTSNPKQENINLVWTQWSKKSIFQLIQSNTQQPQQKRMINKIICCSQQKKNQVANQYNSILKRKYRDISKNTFIQSENDVKNYLNLTKQSRNKNTLLITCNHIEGHQWITDKKNLYYSLKSYCQQNNQSCFNILPLTFHINGNEQQFKNLQEIQQVIYDDDKRIMWITKPGQKSNRGNGIKVFKKIHEIQDFVLSQTQKHPNRTYIIQRYIYPALFHRRKFDIRCFVLLIAAPDISAFFYNDGYLRTSSKEFNDKKCDDKFMHLTNDAVQKKGNDYGKYEKGNKTTFEQYQTFLDMFEKKREVNFKEQILPKLKIMAAKAIAASCHKFNQSKKLYSFQILGYDFMLDQDYKPWLIQVNTNPCIQTGCPVLQQFIPAALNNALKLAVDSVFKPPKINAWHLQSVITFPQKILQQNKFQLIFQQKSQ